jgi:hypothetical protein
MAHDPRRVLPSEWRADSPPRVRSRQAYITELIRRAPPLSAIGLTDLPDLDFDRDRIDTYNAVNTPRLTDAVARVLGSFAERGDLDARVIRTFVTNLTSEGTAVGYAAQLQGYDWLIREGANFVPEIEHAGTLRRRQIALDGQFIPRHGGAFFDIKSYAFEPQLRAVAKRRLEGRLDNATVTIDGPGNHAPDAIQQHFFGSLREHIEKLSRGEIVRITELGWTLRAQPRLSGVATSTAEYDPGSLAHANRMMPLWFSSQFTTDAPYILMLVIPYGFGGNPFGIDVFGSTVDMFDRIAAHVFGAGRLDTSLARDHDREMPPDVSVRDAVACLSGLALLSEPGDGHRTTARIHVNQAARHPLTLEQVQSISPTWTVIVQNGHKQQQIGRYARWAFWAAAAGLIVAMVAWVARRAAS